MKLAIEAAKKGVKGGQTPFGAVIVRKGKVIAAEHNDVWKDVDSTEHAEIVTIRKACKKLNKVDLSDCELYSTCEPCPMCFSAAVWARIPVIIYGARISDAARYGFNEINISDYVMKKMGKIKVKLVKDFMRKECLEVFKLWKKLGGKSY